MLSGLLFLHCNITTCDTCLTVNRYMWHLFAIRCCYSLVCWYKSGCCLLYTSDGLAYSMHCFILICRGTGSSGEMFGLIFAVKDRDLFQMSKVVVGTDYFIVRPSLVGDWNGLTMSTTAQPLLPTKDLFLNEPFLPSKLPEHVCRNIPSVDFLKLAKVLIFTLIHLSYSDDDTCICFLSGCF